MQPSESSQDRSDDQAAAAVEPHRDIICNPNLNLNSYSVGTRAPIRFQ